MKYDDPDLFRPLQAVKPRRLDRELMQPLAVNYRCPPSAIKRKQRVMELHGRGLMQTQIAKRVGITQARVSQILSEYHG